MGRECEGGACALGGCVGRRMGEEEELVNQGSCHIYKPKINTKLIRNKIH